MGRLKKARYIAKYGEEAWEKERQKRHARTKQWREANPDYGKQWREANPDYNKQYKQTQNGRAVNLCCNYRKTDKKYERGECTLTPEWIEGNIFNTSCLYCGESDWRKLGCDRIDNNLPHTPDNVVCCCKNCNDQKQRQGFERFLWLSWLKRFGK